jgi:hypothetical protein
MTREVEAASSDGTLTFDGLLAAVDEVEPEDDALGALVRRVLRAMLEERSTRLQTAER